MRREVSDLCVIEGTESVEVVWGRMTWFGYAADEVPELARGIGGVQKPQLSSPRGGASFPVGRITSDDRPKIPLPKAKPLVLRATLVAKDKFVDVLGLSGRVDEALREAEGRDDGSGPILVDAREGVGAYQIGGGYQVEGEKVTVEVNVFLDLKPVGQATVRGVTSDLDALAKAIVADVDKQFKP